ncbi:unnamed protein product [Mytilus edulis]|uniref:Uncharacterized protein n=1 Tax=Mytilus edulis TaxID=6550 RepID=A0A8S3RYR1_MYTED|nr:unnamed protein product [Mytilus edulis]
MWLHHTRLAREHGVLVYWIYLDVINACKYIATPYETCQRTWCLSLLDLFRCDKCMDRFVLSRAREVCGVETVRLSVDVTMEQHIELLEVYMCLGYKGERPEEASSVHAPGYKGERVNITDRTISSVHILQDIKGKDIKEKVNITDRTNDDIHCVRMQEKDRTTRSVHVLQDIKEKGVNITDRTISSVHAPGYKGESSGYIKGGKVNITDRTTRKCTCAQDIKEKVHVSDINSEGNITDRTISSVCVSGYKGERRKVNITDRGRTTSSVHGDIKEKGYKGEKVNITDRTTKSVHVFWDIKGERTTRSVHVLQDIKEKVNITDRTKYKCTCALGYKGGRMQRRKVNITDRTISSVHAPGYKEEGYKGEKDIKEKGDRTTRSTCARDIKRRKDIKEKVNITDRTNSSVHVLRDIKEKGYKYERVNITDRTTSNVHVLQDIKEEGKYNR